MLGQKKRVEDSDREVPAWQLTYGDMVTLLLVFFVFLSVYATFDINRFREIIMSLKGTLGVLPSGVGPFEPGDLPQTGPDTGEPVPAQTLTQAVPEVFEKSGDKEIEEVGKKREEVGEKDEEEIQEGSEEKLVKDKSEIYTYLTESGQVVIIPDVVEFERGSYEIKEKFAEFLEKLGPLFKYYSTQQVLVIGHADKNPLFSSQYPHNNWELASSRAIEVVKFLVEKHNISQDRFVIQSYGEYKRSQRLVDIIFRPKPEYKKSVGFE